MIPLAATLLADLDTYAAADGRERASLSRIRDFVSGSPNAFSRANPEGHVTASAVVARSRARIIHERLQPSRGSRGFRGRHAPPAHGRSPDTSSDLLCDAPGIAVVGLPRPDEKSLAGTKRSAALLDLGAKDRSSLNDLPVFRPGVRELSGLDPAFLLIWHRKLKRWLQPGGHMEEGDGSVFAAALREAREETGLEHFRFPVGEQILDVDVHSIPSHGPDPAHFHFDIRFLLTVAAAECASQDDEIRWFALPQAVAAGIDESLARALRKAAQIIDDCRLTIED